MGFHIGKAASNYVKLFARAFNLFYVFGIILCILFEGIKTDCFSVKMNSVCYSNQLQLLLIINLKCIFLTKTMFGKM